MNVETINYSCEEICEIITFTCKNFNSLYLYPLLLLVILPYTKRVSIVKIFVSHFSDSNIKMEGNFVPLNDTWQSWKKWWDCSTLKNQDIIVANHISFHFPVLPVSFSCHLVELFLQQEANSKNNNSWIILVQVRFIFTVLNVVLIMLFYAGVH